MVEAPPRSELIDKDGLYEILTKERFNAVKDLLDVYKEMRVKMGRLQVSS